MNSPLEYKRLPSYTALLLLATLFLGKHALANSSKRAYANRAQGDVIVKWPAGNNTTGRLVLDNIPGRPLFKSIDLLRGSSVKSIVKNVDPLFILTVGKRDLISQNGWNIFFDKVPLKPHKSFTIALTKTTPVVSTQGQRTVVSLGELKASDFSGRIEITLYHGSPLINIAAVISTNTDSTAIVFDAGLVSKEMAWDQIAWSDVYQKMRTVKPSLTDTAVNEAVKYRTIIGKTNGGSLALFPGPHQYFYPLDEAFNLKFTWHGNQYRKLGEGYGIGIRQDLYGDNRFVPWFNAPPGTQQRMNFFCWIATDEPQLALDAVKRLTHDDKYLPLKGFKTMSSHFHNEFIMKVVMANKPVPERPSFVSEFRNLGVDMVHLGEFHYTAHPKGPDTQRISELHALFQQCERLSSDSFLLMPGEEPNEFLGGHWLAIFPKPIYWIMARKPDQQFVTADTKYGNIYRIKDSTEMLDLLRRENGLAWTAHARTKGSTGYPDIYKNSSFFKSRNFMGAAWKAMPADLSQPRLGKRILDLMDDMNNWGLYKKTIAEADLFTVEHENEMYAHMNVNYLQLDKIPAFKNGWTEVLNALDHGKFFSSTGEVLIPSFSINNASSGDTATLTNGKANVRFSLHWTFPMQFAEIISGDGNQVYRERIELNNTTAFGQRDFNVSLNFTNRKWVRLEAWDVAANGAFTQTIWLK